MKGTRSPVVAGQFYAGSERPLREQIEECYTHVHGAGKIPEVKEGPRRLIGLVSPHAGYQFSGPVATHGFSHLAEDGRPDLIVLIGPNHSGVGSGVSIDPSDRWRTPLGEVEVEGKLIKKIRKKSDIIDEDTVAHFREHSLEVQLPFLQFLFKNKFKIVPICMMMQDEETSEEVGRAIAEGVEGRDVLIIASTDFTHYESQESAFKKDGMAIDKIKDLDWRGLLQVVSEKNISMCGYGPVSSMLVAALERGAKEAELYKYATSGDTAGPSDRVVGYGSIGVTR